MQSVSFVVESYLYTYNNMIKSLSATAKKIFGSRLYNDIRANYLFRDLDSPYPLYPDTPFHMDWSKNTNQQVNGEEIKAAYIVSPTQRSGTNFLSHMLDKHPDLVFPSGANLPDEQCLYTYSEHLKTYAYKTVSTWNKWVDGGEPALQDHARSLMGAMGSGILKYFTQYVKPGSTLLFKTPDAGHLDNFFHLFQESRVVILVRDGRDTIESFSKSWGGKGAFRKMCERWSKRVDTMYEFIDMAEKAGLKDRIMITRYDYLNDKPREELPKIFAFLNVNADHYPWDEVDNIPVLGSSSYKGDQGEVHWKPIEKDEKFKPTQKWLSWDSSRKEIFKKEAGDNLIKLGFADNNDW